MKKSKIKRKMLIFSLLGSLGAILAPSVLSAACTFDLPVISIVDDPNFVSINEKGEKIIKKRSASSFYELNSKRLFNPISQFDDKYRLFTNDRKLNNTHDTSHVYKIKPDFQFLKFANLSGQYDYRLFSFRYDELVANIPGAAIPKYSQYKHNPKAVFIMLYWIRKNVEAAPNFINDVISPSKSRFPESRPEIEEAPWAFVRNTSPSLKGFWQDVTEPLVLLFEEE
ncbi:MULTISPECIES: hypothetical protein [unclassified Mycoplasma]|uniref:hypothetical protein n=1 Tax=Mycoplasma sp. 125 TaxID=3447505 RepID=UPI003F65DB25